MLKDNLAAANNQGSEIWLRVITLLEKIEENTRK